MKELHYNGFTLYIGSTPSDADACIRDCSMRYQNASRYTNALRYTNATRFDNACKPDALIIQRTQRGKPYFTDEAAPKFSVSHSGGLWGVVMTDRADIGFDMELERERNWRPVARRFFHPEEVELALSHGRKTFFDIWCAKESVVKCTGQGIDEDFSAFSVVRGGATLSPPGFMLIPLKLGDEAGLTDANILPHMHACVCIALSEENHI